MKLLELLDAAKAAYPDEALGQFYNPKTGKRARFTGGDTLARFIVIELIETFDTEASDGDQLERAISVLERAQDELGGVIGKLFSMSEALPKEKETA